MQEPKKCRNNNELSEGKPFKTLLIGMGDLIKNTETSFDLAMCGKTG